MKVLVGAASICSVWMGAAAALEHTFPPSVTVVHTVDLAVRQAGDTQMTGLGLVQVAAVIPTAPGQIGVNPPGSEPPAANIEGHTKYLTEENGSTKWIGVDPSYITVKTTTTTQKGGETAVATVTKGVDAVKNGAGGLNILLSPAVKSKLEAIAKQVTPCAARRRRRLNLQRRAGPACGLADFVQRVGADAELRGNFARPLTDQVWHEIDEGYESDDPTADPGWEGDGGEHVGLDDEGYFSNDDEGFFEGSEAGDGEGTLETIIFSTEEEAAAVGAALAEADAGAVWGGSTVTAGSLLAFLWHGLSNGKAIPNANEIPKESIHRVTKTKTTTTSSTSSSCPTSTGIPAECADGCKPTSVKVDDPKATGIYDWACSAGSTKGCKCEPKTAGRNTFYNEDFHAGIQEALMAIKEGANEPKEPKTSCPGGLSNAPSKFLVDMTSKEFCKDVMSNLESRKGPVAYDIKGNAIPLLKMAKIQAETTRRGLLKRSPPENADNYLDYRFFLEYEPQDGTCLVSKEDLCKNAWQKLVQSPCGNNHGSAGDRMFKEASIDVGCAKFAWVVEKPEEPEEPAPKPEFGTRQCHEAHSHYDVHAGQQDSWSNIGCAMYKDTTMRPGDKDLYWHPVGMAADYHQNYKISWIDGCKAATEQKVAQPLADSEDVTCASVMNMNYHKCNNGGAGGYVDVGCLRYNFYVTNQ